MAVVDPYIVVKGDTLGAIARRNGMTLTELLRLNPGISNPDKISIGQSIILSGGEGEEAEKEEGGGSEYTVVKGDTLNAIAKRNGITLTELLRLNPGIKDPDKISIGQTIVLPGGEGEEADPEAVEGTGIMGGGETIKVGDQWYQIFEYPPGSGTFVSYLYDSKDQLEQVHGEIPEFKKRSQGWYDKNVTVEDDIEDIIGNDGKWGDYVEEITKEALTLAGVTDPSLVGEMLNNPEMRDILTQAALGNWTKAQIKAAQRKTDYWQNVLYPGIAELYGKTAEPEKAWLNYRKSVQGSLADLGYEKDAKGTWDTKIGEMLAKGIDAETFLKNVPIFIRATQNAEFAKVLNQWAERQLGKTIDFDDWFDLMAGEGAPELAEVAETATLAFEAQQQGLNLKEGTILNLASRTELTQAEAIATFANMQQTLLALGDKGLARGNLTRIDVLEAFAGADITSGGSIQEVKLKIQKLGLEQDLFDEKKLTFFVGFTPGGAPTRPGLQALRPEGA